MKAAGAKSNELNEWNELNEPNLSQSSFVLASQSPRRSQILSMLGFTFATASPPFEEVWPESMPASEVPGYLAKGKALSMRAEGYPPHAVILASDTVVVLDGEVLGKPQDTAHALAMLRRLNGRTHEVYTGVALARAGALCALEVVRTEVDFVASSEADLARYAAHDEPKDKAGAYAVQGLGAFMVAGIRGCFFNVMGLPVQATLRLLAAQGVLPSR
jgi:septum formation protein